LSTSLSKFSSFQLFSVFPDANFLKITLFRRLNSQKYLLTNQLNVKGCALDNLSKTRLINFSCLNKPNFLLTELSSSQPKFITSTFGQATSYIETQILSISKYTRVRRIKFKPGYSRLWRVGRLGIKEILQVN
jgi:hypothetical protein